MSIKLLVYLIMQNKFLLRILLFCIFMKKFGFQKYKSTEINLNSFRFQCNY